MSLPEIGENGKLPHLFTYKDGLLLSWVNTDSNQAHFQYARFDGKSWTSADTIAQGDDWFVNWADYPMIASNNEGDLLAHYLEKSSPATFSYDVTLRMKRQSGENWSAPFLPHQDGTKTEHGFVTLLPTTNGTFQVAWLDGRHTSNEGHEHKGAMTLRTALIDPAGSASPSLELDHKTCDCCQTAGYLSNNGPVFVYRDRSDDEIRDIYIVRQVDGQWTEPQAIHHDGWEIAGCPVNGPRIDGIGNELTVAWFTAAAGKPTVKLAFSADGGANFQEPIIVDSIHPYGRVDVVLAAPGKAVVSWLSRDNDKTIIKARLINDMGETIKTYTIAETKAARSSGFPQMAKYGNDLYFAWTAEQDERSTIKMKRVPLNTTVKASL